MKSLLLKIQTIIFIICFALAPIFDVQAQREDPGPLPDTGVGDNGSLFVTPGEDTNTPINQQETTEPIDATGYDDPFGNADDPFADNYWINGSTGSSNGNGLSDVDYPELNYSDEEMDNYSDEERNNILRDAGALGAEDGGGAMYSQTTSDFSSTIAQISNTSTGGRTTQAQAYANGNSSASKPLNGSEGPGSAGACVASNLLGKILSSTIASATSKVVSNLAGRTAAMVRGAVYGVPSNEIGALRYDTAQAKNQITLHNQANTGTAVGIGGIDVIVAPSWDAIGYCIVNALIDYIARSTIAWARSGFQGNPAFIENPEQFFKQLGNIEAGNFLNNLAYGVLGQNICEPFRAQIVLSIARNYLGTSGNCPSGAGYGTGGYGGGSGSINNNCGYATCSLDTIKGNLNGFLKGNFNQGGWNSWIQLSQGQSNNPYSVYLNLSAQLQGSVQKKKDLATQELGWGKGFLSFRKCDEKVAAKDRSKCPITTPGNIIESQLTKTLGISKDRLVLAEKFDQVIAEVVNALIQTALNKVLE